MFPKNDTSIKSPKENQLETTHWKCALYLRTLTQSDQHYSYILATQLDFHEKENMFGLFFPKPDARFSGWGGVL